MLTTAGFFKAFLDFFDFGRTSTVVRLRAFMGSPLLLPEKLKQTMCQSNQGDATGTPDLPSFVGAFLLEFDNACVTHLGEVPEKTCDVIAS